MKATPTTTAQTPELPLFPFTLISDPDHKQKQRATVARLTRRAAGWKLADCTRRP